MSARTITTAILLVAACGTPPDATAPSVTYTEQREPCASRDPLRQLYFGDLHFHTIYSWDAYGYYLTVTPSESYAFARGDAAVRLPPLDDNGKGTREVRLQRPLDFAAVTDHSEYFGETLICRTEGSAAYDSIACQRFREMGASSVAAWGTKLGAPKGKRNAAICGDDGSRCKTAAKDVWSAIQRAAEEAYDRSADCRFVTFVGYEYTATPTVTNLHRNVIHRNEVVTELPISYFEQSTPWGLLSELQRQCLDAGNTCDVMSIPHNANWSNGSLYLPEFDEAAKGFVQSPEAAAALRASLEPIIELNQHKGDMECENGLSGAERKDDPQCAFEKLRFAPLDDCMETKGWGGVMDLGCTSRYDFLRGILLGGMSEQDTLGINPYRLGVIGSTDSHNGTPGNTDERSWPGHVGVADDTAVERLGEGNITHNGLVNNPGGLAAVWAVERSRDAIFDALARREVYSTSGTRIAVRFFGGWSFDETLCDSPDRLVSQGYASGVPMGGSLAARGTRAPVFVLRAEQDPGTKQSPGTPLQQAQIIKGWIDSQGKAHEKVYTVAGDADSNASVDSATCKASGDSGAATLCAVWRDPDYDPAQRAFYYARVLEDPTCRWHTWLCNELDGEKPEGCSDERVQRVIQERAVSSPIWIDPQTEE